MADTPVIVVTAAVVERGDCFLVTRRLAGSHLEGMWEFPGGKCEPGESHRDCLLREIDEELGVEARVGALVLSTRHQYPERIVELHFYACTIDGEPLPQLDQQMQWVPRDMLGSLEFPPADAELIRMLSEGER